MVFDFSELCGWRRFRPASRDCMRDEGAATISGYQERSCSTILGVVWERLLNALSITVTAMFRDSVVLSDVSRKKVVPLLRTYPFIRISGTPGVFQRAREVYFDGDPPHGRGAYTTRCRTFMRPDMSIEAPSKSAREGIFPLAAIAGVHAQLHGAREASGFFSPITLLRSMTCVLFRPHYYALNIVLFRAQSGYGRLIPLNFMSFMCRKP